jgi:hypothetical protein
MLRKMPDEDVRRLGRGAVLMYWIYRVPPGETVARRLPQLGRYRALGFDVIGAAASKGADGPWSNLPNFAGRMDNLDLWGEALEGGGLEGLVATAWSRYNSFSPQCDVPEAQHMALAYAAERAWSGRARPRRDFERHYGEWAFGLRHSGAAVAAGHHAMNRAGRGGSAWGLELSMVRARRGRDRLRLVAALGRLEDHLAARARLVEQLDRMMPLITGPLPVEAFAGLAEAVGRLEAEGRRLGIALPKLLSRSILEDEVEEFMESRLAPTGRLVRRARELLR